LLVRFYSSGPSVHAGRLSARFYFTIREREKSESEEGIEKKTLQVRDGGPKKLLYSSHFASLVDAPQSISFSNTTQYVELPTHGVHVHIY